MTGDSNRVDSTADLPFTKAEVLRIVNDPAATPQERNLLLTMLFNTYVAGERLLSPAEQAAYRAQYSAQWQEATRQPRRCPVHRRASGHPRHRHRTGGRRRRAGGRPHD